MYKTIKNNEQQSQLENHSLDERTLRIRSYSKQGVFYPDYVCTLLGLETRVLCTRCPA